MDHISRQNLMKLLKEAGKKPVSVFTDLDLTSCQEGNSQFSKQNKDETGYDGCFMQPDIRRALMSLSENDGKFYIVTGRHWKDYRQNDLTGEKIPDGAFYDLLGGVKDFENADVVAGHGRLLIKDGKTTVLRRAASEQDAFKEQKFERYVGENVLRIKEEIFKRWPDARGQILAEYKKHLSYINVADFAQKNPEEGAKITQFAYENLTKMMTSDQAPENPNNALYFAVEPTGAMEIRSRNQSKRNGIEKSGFLEQAYLRGGPVVVMGDSLKPNGTDRDLVEGVRDFFKSKAALDRVFVIHVMNGIENRICDEKDSCYPSISVENPTQLGQVMKMVAGQSKARVDNKCEKKIVFSAIKSMDR